MKKNDFEITALTLHLLAMAAMLLDHMWAAVIPGNLWLTCVGRIAYPIFAFLTVEGYFHTGNFRNYLRRLLVLAVISEIPFNLLMGSSVFYWAHQNVIWTFLIALCAIHLLEAVRQKPWLLMSRIAASAGITFLAALLGLLSFADYNAAGVLTVLIFYFFRGRKWWQYLLQAAALWWLHGMVLKGMDIPVRIFSHLIFFPTQGFALLALIPIWLYRGKQGSHSRAIRCICYAFYPLHMLILYGITLLF